MTNDANNERPIKGATGKLLICGGATALWLIAAAWIGYFAHPPMDDLSCKGTFACLTASEWGDYLAGVFAPIAFVWLVVTVWIQSDELREQRVELALTRKEFELNRAVMEEQAKEARRQAEYVAMQTSLLDDEANARKADAHLASFMTLMSRYVEHSRESRESVFYQRDLLPGYLFCEVKLGSNERYVYTQWEHTNSILAGKAVGLKLVGDEIFEEVFIFIYSAEELVDSIPYHSRVSWKRSKLTPLLDNYCRMIVGSNRMSHLQGHVEARDRRLGRSAVNI